MASKKDILKRNEHKEDSYIGLGVFFNYELHMGIHTYSCFNECTEVYLQFLSFLEIHLLKVG